MSRWTRRRERALVFAPYLNTMGGGERVIVRVTEVLGSRAPATLYSPQIRDDARWFRLGFPDVPVTLCDARRFMRSTIGAGISGALTNHSALPSFARVPLLIVQFPTDDLRELSWQRRTLRRAMMRRYRIVTYSQFNADLIEQRWGFGGSIVLAPPVRQYSYEPTAKEPTVLSVGRIGTAGGHKRHDALLDAWSMLQPRLPGWRLVIAGGGSESDEGVQRLRERAATIEGVTIHADADPELLGHLYSTASIYWHATGYGREASRPDLAEHFGMTTVEAMSAGAVPVVYRDGGQPEIVDGTMGATWTTLAELVETTFRFATDPTLIGHAALDVSAAAKRYDADTFAAGLLSVVGLSAGGSRRSMNAMSG